MSLKKFFGIWAGIFLFSQYAFSQDVKIVQPSGFAPMADSIAAYLKPLASVYARVRVDSVESRKGDLLIYLSNSVSDYSLRRNNVADIYGIASRLLPEEFKGKKLSIRANGSSLEELTSEYYTALESRMQKANGKSIKKTRKAKAEEGGKLVENLSRPYAVTEGLQDKHIALWQSHGYYYEQSLQRWEWQRARIFQTVEDLYTQSYVLPFLVPMLENAGANVLLPRERDVQINEVIVDNDASESGYSENSGDFAWTRGDSAGFASPKAFYLSGENPFRMGTYKKIRTVKASSLNRKNAPAVSSASWLPSIPQEGEYAVYVSYWTEPDSAEDAVYTVRHKGGETVYKVNQRMGGGTWIYLGTFLFDRGRTSQGVYLSNATGTGKGVITADAVKFGGGMGNIARCPSPEIQSNRKSSSDEPLSVEKIEFETEPEISGYPRFTEGSRYWLQWAGFADTVYTYSNNTNDYNDDYMSRGRWVNVLAGGSKVNPDYKGLNIPVDMSFAFHSDAGTFLDDSIVGTLAIYTRYSNGSDKYPSGKSRMAGRELADLIQTQIVEDVRRQFEPKWSRRNLWDRSYAESRAPNVPAMLLELLSHQNFADMKYGLDPNFRFTVSRAIYKGILRYFSLTRNLEYVVQPLPVKDFSAILEKTPDGLDAVRLTWSPSVDTLEATAVAKQYIVYTRTDGGGFDNGRIVKDTSVVFPVEAGKIYSYKVAALNEGGESFPSEILSAAIAESSIARNKTVLIVNGFDRVSAPAFLQSKDSTLAGFYDGLDHGVPYIRDISYIGSQHEFRREIPWMDDDAPGFGASYGDYEDKVIAGNTFDYPYVHGLALLKRGYNFVSSSAGAVMSGHVRMSDYPVADVIMGKQATTPTGRGVMPSKYTVFPPALQKALADYCLGGGNLLVSGAYIATDLWDPAYCPTKEGQKFATDILKYRWMTHYASKTGEVKSVANPFGFKGKYNFHEELNDKVYAVESPDALVPVGPGAYTIFRYRDNNISAGVAYKGDYKTVSLGFPIETLEDRQQLDELMGEILRFFETE